MKEIAVSVTFCGGWRFSTREKELDVIKACLKNGNINLEDRYDFSMASFEFIHDDENNQLVAELSRSGWMSQSYKIRRFLQNNGGVVVQLRSGKVFGFAFGETTNF